MLAEKASRHRMLIFTLAMLTFGQRLVLPLGAIRIPMIVPAIIGYMFYGLLRGHVQVHRTRVFLFGTAIASCLLAAVVTGAGRPTSLAFLVLLYIPFTLVCLDPSAQLVLLRSNRKMMSVLAVVGIGQFLLQIVGVPAVDLVRLIVPGELLHFEYNTWIPLNWQETTFKSNGLFFLEPSFFSKHLAIAILGEFVLSYRLGMRLSFRRLALFALALLMTFSGTGLVMVAVGLPILLVGLVRRRLINLIPVILAIAAAVVAFVASGYSTFLTDRTAEFAAENESAYRRFVAPYRALGQAIDSGSVFGVGAGGVDAAEDEEGFYASSVVKLYIEYGPIATLFFAAFILYCFFHRPRDRVLAFTLFLSFAVLAGGLLQPQTLYFTLLLSTLFYAPKFSSG